MNKLLGAIGAIAAATLALGACGSSSNSKPGEVNLWVVSGTDTLKPYVNSYNASHTDGKVKLREIPFTNFDTVTNQALQAKNGPDLVMVNSVTLGTFASKGQLADITKV